MQQFGSNILPPGHPAVKLCERVVERLGPATGMEGGDWKVYVIDSDVPNAFVIPGGQIFVFSVPSLPTQVFSPALTIRGFYRLRGMRMVWRRYWDMRLLIIRYGI